MKATSLCLVEPYIIMASVGWRKWPSLWPVTDYHPLNSIPVVTRWTFPSQPCLRSMHHQLQRLPLSLRRKKWGNFFFSSENPTWVNAGFLVFPQKRISEKVSISRAEFIKRDLKQILSTGLKREVLGKEGKSHKVQGQTSLRVSHSWVLAVNLYMSFDGSPCTLESC